MLQSIQTDIYQKQIRQQLQDIRHNLKFLQKVATDLGALTGRKKDADRQVLLQRGEVLRVELKQKLKAMQVNVGQVVAMLDWKVGVVVKQLTKIQKQLKQKINTTLSQTNQQQSTTKSKQQQQNKQLITQLQQQIFQLQKRQNQHVKQISQLKQKNAKLRQQFTNLSFDSNQRIKQLSEKLHNNTSPNLGIKKIQRNCNNVNGIMGKMETSYFVTNDQIERKNIVMNNNGNNNFVKIKGTAGGMGNNNIEMSPNNNVKIKTKNNLLDSFTSQSSEFDIKPYGDQAIGYEQSSSNRLMLGCFPSKQISQKTKTGSSSQNKKLKFEQNCEKSRRFQFLLNNLIDDTNQKEQTSMQNAFPITQPLGQSLSDGNCRYPSPIMTQNNNYQQLQNGGYRQKSYSRSPIMMNQVQNEPNPKSVFNQMIVKRYQI